MANFPASLPSFTITSGTETANGAAGGLGLSGLLNSFEGEITAVATKIGTGSTTPASGKILRATGTGTSSWSQLVMSTDVAAFTSADILAVVSDETGTGALVFGTSPTLATPTLTTPVIGNFTSAQHNHTNAAGGGQLGTAALSNASVTADKLATGAARSFIATSETTASTSFVDLATVQNVTVIVGANGLLLVGYGGQISNSGANGTYLTVALSSANTYAAVTADAQISLTTAPSRATSTRLFTGLTPGSTVVTVKFKVDAGTGTFLNRELWAMPL